jgi:hypothetical protein
MMIATSDVKHMRGQHGAFLLWLPCSARRRPALMSRPDGSDHRPNVSSSGRLVSIRIDSSKGSGRSPAPNVAAPPRRRGHLLQAPRVPFDRRLD